VKNNKMLALGSAKHAHEEPRQIPLFSNTPLLNIKNFDESNLITTVAISHTTIAIGTQTGRIFVFNLQSNTLIDDYAPHQKKVTGIWVQHGKAVHSVSFDQKLFVRSLNRPEFSDQMLTIDE
jgi:hypothetical protein